MSEAALQLIDTAASLIGAMIAAVIAWQVYVYTKKKDKMAVIHDMWKQQQEWNLVAAGSPAHAKAVEQMVYGLQPKNDDERLALNACLFYFINRINHLYDAYTSGIVSYSEFLDEAKVTAPLCAGHPTLLNALLDNRGYDPAFATELKRIVSDLAIVGSVDVFKEKVDAPNN